MSSKVPEGLRYEVTPKQAYPRGIPEIPDGWEFARFGYNQGIGKYEAVLESNGTLSGISVPREARVIVRRKQEPVKQGQPEPTKPRRMQGNAGSVWFAYHRQEHDEVPSCSFNPLCIPVNTNHVSTGLWCSCERRWDDPVHEKPEPVKPRMMRFISADPNPHPEEPGCEDFGCIPVDPVEQPAHRGRGVAMTREQVYKAIGSERDFQDRKWGTIEKHPHEVGGWLTIMRKLLRDAEAEWSESAGDYGALQEIRKIISVGVACCEQHGVEGRSKFTEPPVQTRK